MSTATAPTAGGPAPTRPHRVRRPPLAGTLVVLALVLAAALATLLSSTPAARPLDPTDPGPRGAKALAEVVQRHGTRVQTVHTSGDLAASRPDADTTVLVTDASRLSTPARTILKSLHDAGRIVLLAPNDTALDSLDIPAHTVSDGPRITADCDDDLVDPGDTISSGATLYRPDHDGVQSCFSVLPSRSRTDESNDTSDTPGTANPPSALLDVPATRERPRTVVVGAPAAFSNAHITRESHAALARRLLDGEHIVWFLPDPDEFDPATDTPPQPELPAWITPVLTLLGLTSLLLCLWRGRRLGPLVTEPLPVVVPADETTRARARLYARSGDVAHSAALLSDAALTDLRTRLRLPAGTSPHRVAQETERATGTPADDVLRLLRPPVPVTDLDDHARALHRLRRKVRTP